MPSSPQPSWALKPGPVSTPKPSNPGSGQAPTDPSIRVAQAPLTDPSTRVSGRS